MKWFIRNGYMLKSDQNIRIFRKILYKMKLPRPIHYLGQLLSLHGMKRRRPAAFVDFRKEKLLAEYRKNKDTAKDIMEYGERITHLFPNNCFYAHLSLYYLSLPFIENGSSILDAGSGSGYGTAYLSSQGNCNVIGIELSPAAVAFSARFFRMNNLAYKQMDLENITGFDSNYFDFVFSSNVLEHIENVPAFLYGLCRVLKPTGKLFIVVPSIVSDADKKNNMGIFQHLNIWAPTQWDYVLKKYFKHVRCFSHIAKDSSISTDFNNTPEDETFTEKDFVLKQVEVDDLGYREPTFGAVFLAEAPLPQKELPAPEAGLDFIDESFTRPRPIICQYNCHSCLDEIRGQVKVVQSFFTTGAICQIDIMFEVFGRETSGDVSIRLKDDLCSDADLVFEEIKGADLAGNEWCEIKFKPLQSSTGWFYIIIESLRAVSGSPVTVKASDLKCFADGELLVNGKRMDRDIVFKVFGPTRSYLQYQEYLAREKASCRIFEGALVRGKDGSNEGKVYLIEKGQKRWITSPSVFEKCGFKWNQIRTVGAETLNAVPTGEPIAAASNIRHDVASPYLRGTGIEIGAGVSPHPLPPGVECEYYDKRSERELAELFKVEISGINKVYSLDVFRERFPEKADFLIAHHVLEHLSDPIGALLEWHSYVKDGGTVVLSVPDADCCPDKGRLFPSFAHLLLDYLLRRNDDSFESREHIYSFVMGWIDDGFAKELEKLEIARKTHECAKAPENDLHWHAFNETLFRQVIMAAAAFGKRTVSFESAADPYSSDPGRRTTNEIICVYRVDADSVAAGTDAPQNQILQEIGKLRTDLARALQVLDGVLLR
ncbi:MAG: hypothetical protein C0402_06410 [Thermodesulfovibrio sp.]|nr:hypothetical protein [Thermodesulfovibrio sp.]